ncbi:MAG: hypothetical protein E7438_01195 [Ruminococcaceae bacterium]|nr:hypothetical protein [Oscillospiraceae bacterium]
MKKIISFVMLCIVGILLGACVQTDKNNMVYVEQEIVLYPTLNTTYSYSEVRDYIYQKKSQKPFAVKFQIQAYKSINGIDYTVIRTDEGLCLILFGTEDARGNILKIVFSDNDAQEHIKSLGEGATLTDVKNADPKGDYSTVEADGVRFPIISYHYFENGDCYCIEYSNGQVVEMVKFTI